MALVALWVLVAHVILAPRMHLVVLVFLLFQLDPVAQMTLVGLVDLVTRLVQVDLLYQ